MVILRELPKSCALELAMVISLYECTVQGGQMNLAQNSLLLTLPNEVLGKGNL